MANHGKIYYGSTLVGDVHMPPVVGDFGGLSFSPGPMYVTEGGEYGLCRSFDEHCSYGASSLGNIGYVDGYRTYFQLLELGNYFDSAGSNWETVLYTSGGHNIDNQGNLVYGPDNSGTYHSDWRVPTFNEFNKIFFPVSGGTTLTRTGSTVNGVSGVVGVAIRVQKTTRYASIVPGVMAFPDKQTITGADIITSDSTSDYYNFQSLTGHPITYSQGYPYITGAMSTPAHLITEEELNEFIKQGCVFLPDMGRAYPEAATSSISWLYRGGAYSSSWYGINFTTYIQTNSSAIVYGYFFGHDYSGLSFGAGNYNQVTGGFQDYLHTYTPAYLVRTYGSGEGA